MVNESERCVTSVIYIDDEPDLLEVTAEYLKFKGKFNVDTAVSARLALEKMKEKRYDAIISDYQMPGMNGIELLKTIRFTNPSIPFIIFTGRGREEVAIEAFESGADFYLQKGGDPRSQYSELIHKINQAIRRKEAEEALVESEERYRNVVEAQTELICRFTPDGTHIFVNEAYCRYFDIRREDIIGRKYVPKIPKEEQNQVKKYFSSLTYDKPVGSIEHRILMPDGTLRWQRWNDRAIFDKNKVIIEYQSVGRDVTNLKETEDALRREHDQLNDAYEVIAATEEELRKSYLEMRKDKEALQESEERYRRFFTTSMDCVFITTMDGNWIDFNDSAVEFFGYSSRDELKEINIRDLYQNPSDRALLLACISEKGYAKEYPVKLKKKEGTVIYCLISTVPIRWMGDSVIEFQGTIRDMTERKKVDDALREANRQLNLLNSITRHDILDGITGILGLLEILKKKKSDPELAQIIRKIENQTNTIRSQIAFTRIFKDLGTREPQWQAIQSVLAKLEIPRPIRLRADCPDVEIYADLMLEQVFANLIDNSVVHGGHVSELQVSCKEYPSNLAIFYEDNGTGIPIEEKQRIFERGYGQHTGFGLFLAKEVLSITGITINEIGEPGEGASFEMVVPKGSFRFRS